MAKPVSCWWQPRLAIVPPMIGSHNLLTYLHIMKTSANVESNKTSQASEETS